MTGMDERARRVYDLYLEVERLGADITARCDGSPPGLVEKTNPDVRRARDRVNVIIGKELPGASYYGLDVFATGDGQCVVVNCIEGCAYITTQPLWEPDKEKKS